MQTSSTIGVIGLGILGGMLAETLRAHGHHVTGYGPAAAARKRLAKCSGRRLASAAAVAQSADIIIVSLASSAALKAVSQELASAAKSSSSADFGRPVLSSIQSTAWQVRRTLGL